MTTKITAEQPNAERGVVGSGVLFYGSTWTETMPDQEGWWWMLIGTHAQIVRMIKQRAFGNRLCCVYDRSWTPVDELDNALWAGPIPHPTEP